MSEAEFAELEQWAAQQEWDIHNTWSIVEMRVKRRLEPMTDDEWLVLALLCNQERDVTLLELHQKCGDGLTVEAMRQALFGLQDRGLAGGGKLRYCAVCGEDRAPWEATTAGRELNAET